MKKVLLKSACLLLLVAAFTSCLIPYNKETYLKNFKHFVDDVGKNGEKFSLSDWHYANKRFGKYTGEWYDKYSEMLTMEEKLEVNGLKIRYMSERGKNRFARFFKNDFGKDLDEVKEDVEHYLKKDLNKDMQELSKGAREIGDSAKKVVEEIIRETRKKE